MNIKKSFGQEVIWIFFIFRILHEVIFKIRLKLTAAIKVNQRTKATIVSCYTFKTVFKVPITNYVNTVIASGNVYNACISFTSKIIESDVIK